MKFERKREMKLNLRGELTNARLVEVLNNLKQHQYYGTLLITDGPREKCFFFARGGLRMAKSKCPSNSLGEYLKAKQVLVGAAASTYDAELRKTRDQSLSRTYVCKLCEIEPRAFDQLERDLMASEFLETLFWENCTFEYRSGDPDQEAYQKNLKTSLLSMGIKKLVDELIEKATKIRDLRRLIPSGRARIRLTEMGTYQLEVPSPGIPIEVLATLARLGETSAENLANKLAGWTEYDLIKKISDWSDLRYLDMTIPKSTSEDEVLQRIQRIEDGMDLAISPIMRRQALAKTYRDNNDDSAAARHYKKAGQLMLIALRPQEAAKELREAFTLLPEDFEAHESLVEALWASKSTDQARDETLQLARRYFDLGLANRTRLILEKALEYGERDLDIRFLLVRAYLKLGRSEKALDLGREVCADLRAAGRVEEAVRLAERFVTAGVDQERVLVMTGEKSKRTKKRVLLAIAGLLGLLLAPMASAMSARLDFKERAPDIEMALNNGQYKEARTLLKKFQSDHDWGFISGTIRDFDIDIKNLERTHGWFLQRLGLWVEKKSKRINWALSADITIAQEALKRLQAHENMSMPQYSQTHLILTKSISRYIAEARRLRKDIRVAYANEEHARVHKISQLFYNNYRNVLTVRSTFKSYGVPFKIRCEPATAKIYDRTGKKYVANKIFYLKPKLYQLTFRAKGYIEQNFINVKTRNAPFELPIIKLKKIEEDGQ
jgi:hypothetical protein